MKQIKAYIVILLLAVLIIPSVALAAWWNPFTWNWNIFDLFSKPQISTFQPNKNTSQVQNITTQTPIGPTACQRNLNCTAGQTCRADSDCGPRLGLECKNEICTPQPPECNSNSDCIKGQTCQNRVCMSCQSSFECSSGQICQRGTCIDSATCHPNWICSWGPCVNGNQQQYGYDANVCDGGYGGEPIQTQNVACSPLNRTCASSIPQSITIISPKGGDVWQIGSTQTVEYSGSGLNIDGFLIDSNGKEIPMSMGNYVGMGGYNLTFKLDASTISPGTYKVELKISNCGEGFCPYSVWGTSNGYITIVSSSTGS